MPSHSPSHLARSTLGAFLIICLLVPQVALAFSPHHIIGDEEFANSLSMSEADIQSFLESHGSGLARLTLSPSKLRPSTIIARAADTFTVNPKVLLVLLQKEQSLINDPTPSTKQLQWATGYGVCDSCRLSSPHVQKYRGFQTQVEAAAELLRSLVDDPARSRIQKGRGTRIDTTTVTPSSNATAALYTYTPHLHGNLVFWGLWNRWFEREYPDGTLLKSPTDGKIWYIRYGQRRLINSLAVLRSRFGTQSVVTVAGSGELEKYPIGPNLALQNFSLVRTPNGSIHLIDGDEYHPIPSMDVFRLLGFNPDEVDDIPEDALEGYKLSTPLTNSSAYPTGALLQDKNTGAIFFVRDDQKHPLIDKSLLAQFPHHTIVTSPDELNQFTLGEPILLPDGSLVKAPHQKTVFLISEQKKKPIASEKVFLTLGFDRKKILTVPERVLALHTIGEPIDAPTSDIPTSAIRPQFR